MYCAPRPHEAAGQVWAALADSDPPLPCRPPPKSTDDLTEVVPFGDPCKGVLQAALDLRPCPKSATSTPHATGSIYRSRTGGSDLQEFEAPAGMNSRRVSSHKPHLNNP